MKIKNLLAGYFCTGVKYAFLSHNKKILRSHVDKNQKQSFKEMQIFKHNLAFNKNIT